MIFAVLLLSCLVGIEVYGFANSSNLVLLTQLADVISDLSFYLLVLLVAAFSWYRDSKGRVHTHGHPEEQLAGAFSLGLLALGVGISSIICLEQLKDPEKATGFLGWFAPMLGLGFYLLIFALVKNEDQNPSKRILEAHLIGDLATAILVLGLSLLVIVSGSEILNPAAALLAVAVFIGIFVWKLLEFLDESSGQNRPHQGRMRKIKRSARTDFRPEDEWKILYLALYSGKPDQQVRHIGNRID